MGRNMEQTKRNVICYRQFITIMNWPVSLPLTKHFTFTPLVNILEDEGCSGTDIAVSWFQLTGVKAKKCHNFSHKMNRRKAGTIFTIMPIIEYTEYTNQVAIENQVTQVVNLQILQRVSDT